MKVTVFPREPEDRLMNLGFSWEHSKEQAYISVSCSVTEIDLIGKRNATKLG
jgi:hypothetical protein